MLHILLGSAITICALFTILCFGATFVIFMGASMSDSPQAANDAMADCAWTAAFFVIGLIVTGVLIWAAT